VLPRLLPRLQGLQLLPSPAKPHSTAQPVLLLLLEAGKVDV
jgi:hypothetical protein